MPDQNIGFPTKGAVQQPGIHVDFIGHSASDPRLPGALRKETASGAKDDRAERKKVLALAQARNIDIILATELTRWGRSMLDLFHTLQDLQVWGISLVAQTGLQFDLRRAQGKLIASLMAALAEFERDLLRERVRSGIAASRRCVTV